MEKEDHRLNIECLTFKSMVTDKLSPDISICDIDELAFAITKKLKENNQG